MVVDELLHILMLFVQETCFGKLVCRFLLMLIWCQLHGSNSALHFWFGGNYDTDVTACFHVAEVSVILRAGTTVSQFSFGPPLEELWYGPLLSWSELWYGRHCAFVRSRGLELILGRTMTQISPSVLFNQFPDFSANSQRWAGGVTFFLPFHSHWWIICIVV